MAQNFALNVTDFKVSLCFAPDVLGSDIRALVIKLLTFGKTDFHFYKASLEIHAKRNQGEALLTDLLPQFSDLILVHEKAPLAQRIPVEEVAFFVGGNVHAVDEDLPVMNLHIGFFDRAMTHPDRFDLRSEEFDARFDRLEDKIIVVGLFIIGYEFD